MEKKKVIIGIVGENLAGKQAFVEWLKEKFDLLHLSVSVEIDRFASENEIDLADRPAQKEFANRTREKWGGDFFVRALIERITDDSPNFVVIESIRCMDEMDYLKKCAIPVFCITAPLHLRTARLDRNSKKDEVSFREFRKQELEEIHKENFKQNIPACLERCSEEHHIQNSFKTKEEFFEYLNDNFLQTFLTALSVDETLPAMGYHPDGLF